MKKGKRSRKHSNFPHRRVSKKRDATELLIWLTCLLRTYRDNRELMKLDHDAAVKKTLESYHDCQDWLYYEGDFKNDAG